MEVLANTKEKVQINLSTNLKRYREMHGWDQYELAAESELKQPAVAAYEQMTRFPRAKDIQKLAKACKTTPGSLIEEPQSVPKGAPLPPDEVLRIVAEAIQKPAPSNIPDRIMKKLEKVKDWTAIDALLTGLVGEDLQPDPAPKHLPEKNK